MRKLSYRRRKSKQGEEEEEGEEEEGKSVVPVIDVCLGKTALKCSSEVSHTHK